MAQPIIEVLGVYRLPISPELVRAQVGHFGREWAAEHPAAALEAAREELEGTALVELRIHGRDDRFHVNDFTQKLEPPRDQWQAAWMEVCLSENGQSLRTKPFDAWPSTGDLRGAFYLHLWDPQCPLETSYGPVVCPKPGPMPDRLWDLVPYEPVD
jgi:hypothetical protein